MLKPLKLDGLLRNVWITSDYHIHHDKPFILQPRGFISSDEHDNVLIARWNERVNDDATVIHLGDLMAQSDEKGFWALVRRLRFKRLLLLLGNHVSAQKQAYQTILRAQFPSAFPAPTHPIGGLVHYEVYPLHACVDGDPSRTVTFLPEYVEITVAGKQMTLCHYPITAWHGQGKGLISLHGHCHGSLSEKMPRRRDVGVECYGGPINLATLVAEMEKESVAKIDHHAP